MSNTEDPCQVAEAAFEKTWHESLIDYAQRRINSEKCLQASLYAGLRAKLSNEFRVFVEATIWLPDGKRQSIDLLICHGKLVVSAIELKYKPKAKIHNIGMYADINKLLNLRNYRAKSESINIEIRRYVGDSKKDKESFKFAPDRRIIFGAYCQNDDIQATLFWKTHRASLSAPASSRRTPPPRLMICLARTDASLAVLSQMVGGKSIKATTERIAIDA